MLLPKGKKPLFIVRAEGVQIYKAKMVDGNLEWVFQAPEATLFDYRSGERVGTHSKEKGPVWVDNAGSKLTGKPIANDNAPNESAIPWLLLETKNPNGGKFAKVSHIQRVDTWAGQSPAKKPAKAGEEKKVRYQATYIFLGN
jgi:hypothetical protein